MKSYFPSESSTYRRGYACGFAARLNFIVSFIGFGFVLCNCLFGLAISVLAEDRKIAVLNLGGRISEQTCELLLVSLSENGFSIVERDKMKQFSNEVLIALRLPEKKWKIN